MATRTTAGQEKFPFERQRISDELFDDLDAPVRRVAATDTFVAYQPLLEDAILPQADDLYEAMADMAEY